MQNATFCFSASLDCVEALQIGACRCQGTRCQIDANDKGPRTHDLPVLNQGDCGSRGAGCGQCTKNTARGLSMQNAKELDDERGPAVSVDRIRSQGSHISKSPS